MQVVCVVGTPPPAADCLCMVTVCAGAPDDISALGLAYGDYTLMPLWIWLYCIFWWFIQDTFKVGWARYWGGGRVSQVDTTTLWICLSCHMVHSCLHAL